MNADMALRALIVLSLITAGAAVAIIVGGVRLRMKKDTVNGRRESDRHGLAPDVD